MNNHFRGFVEARQRVLVIDTCRLGSSRCLLQVVGRRNVYVCGNERGLAAAAKRVGIPHVYEGWSGAALRRWSKLRGKFHLIFLDYCGTPDRTTTCDPSEDVAIASTMVRKGGVVVATFCKRCSHCMTKIVNMTPPGMRIQRTYEYCDTSPMIMVAYSARSFPRWERGSASRRSRRPRGTVARSRQPNLPDGARLRQVRKSEGIRRDERRRAVGRTICCHRPCVEQIHVTSRTRLDLLC